jgi:dUTP pyrophosphatase
MTHIPHSFGGDFSLELKKAMEKKESFVSPENTEMITRLSELPYELPYKRFDENLPTLFREDEKNAGYDLFARLQEPLTVSPGEVAMVPLNVATEIPPYGVGLLFQRSSTYRKWKVKLTNGVGVVDALFSGDNDEWGAEFKNESNETITINPGDKVCQAVFLSLLPIQPNEYPQLGNKNRGGFGTSFDNADSIKGVVINEEA